MEEAGNGVLDQRIQVARDRHVIDPAAHGEIEQLTMQTPGHLKLIRGQGLACLRIAGHAAQFDG